MQLWRSLCELRAAGLTIVLITNQANLFHRPEVSRIAVIAHGTLVNVAPYMQLRHTLFELGFAHGTEACEESTTTAPAVTHKERVVYSAPPCADAADGAAFTPTHPRSMASDRPADSRISIASGVRAIRAALSRHQGQTVNTTLIERLVAVLQSGDSVHALDEEKKQGFITSADFAVYLQVSTAARPPFMLRPHYHFVPLIWPAGLWVYGGAVGTRNMYGVWRVILHRCQPLPRCVDGCAGDGTAAEAGTSSARLHWAWLRQYRSWLGADPPAHRLLSACFTAAPWHSRASCAPCTARLL